ncbi:MAG: polynucleotide adenylyltransferase PcnB [bacterium]|nr:polynucleotide adenylyltransferase PcnB [bacterium]
MLRKILRLFKSGPASLDDVLRYPEGKRIYREFHDLRREGMDQDALKVINRLNRHGYRSYLVGGCVRDMLLGRRPKDFDVVTTATPTQIRKVFSNSRSIGRRFKIVHVVFQGGKIIEVATFRNLPDHRLEPDKKEKDYMMKRDNQYGSPREDAARRDFSLNALFFDPRNESLIDYVGGFDDIKKKRISVIGNPDISYKEDPVRMLRAAKFAALLEFDIDNKTLKAIKRNKSEIAKASPARMLDEYAKIFRTGRSAEIFRAFEESGLFKAMFPEAHNASDCARAESFLDSSIGRRLVIADRTLSEREELTVNIMVALIFTDMVKDVFDDDGPHSKVMDYVKNHILPVCRRMQLSNADRDRLVQIFMSQGRFSQTDRSRRFRPDVFRKKVFFYEAFMVFKINALAEQNDERIQKAMFWEIGPRERPPEINKIVSLFPVRRNSNRGGRSNRRGGGGGGDRNRSRNSKSGSKNNAKS